MVIHDAGTFLSHRIELARAIRDEGYELHVLIPDGECLKPYASEFKFHFYSIHRKSLSPISSFKTLIQMIRLYRKLKPDIIHHFTIKPVIFGSIAIRTLFYPVRVFNTITGMGFVYTATEWWVRPIRYFIDKLYQIAFSDPRIFVIFQNEDDRKQILNVTHFPTERTALIPGAGVDLNRFKYAEDGEIRNMAPFIVFLPARMLWHKGIRETVSAIENLKKEGLHVELWLAGGLDPGNHAAIPETQLRQWEKNPAIKWLGMRTDIPELMTQAHVVCLPSYREGVPLSLLEALGIGRAIVTTDAPGCREVVTDGVNGFLCPVADSKAIEIALRRIYKNPALRIKMARESRRLAEEKYDRKIIFKQSLETYRK